MKESPKFEDLKGKVLVKVENKEDEELIFTTADGEVFKLYHEQSCCERVDIEDICGDLSDLIGEPLLVAEEVTYEDVNPDGIEPKEKYHDSFTWTFYKLGTRKGGVTVRWYGQSNGYYSESVDFCQVTQLNEEEAMHLSVFIARTDETAVYPDAGKSTPLEICYLTLGLCGEVAEFNRADMDDYLELGDVYWYAGRGYRALSELLGLDWRQEPKDYSDTVIAGGLDDWALAAGNYAKKLLRDGMKSEYLKALRDIYSDILVLLRLLADQEFVAHGYVSSRGDILERLLEKLADRKDRGVIQGAGDSR